MAIIRCPECGKDVSDTSPSCIHCGFQLAKHFGKLKAQNDLQKELDEKLNAIASLNSPDKPTLFGGRGTELFLSLLCLSAGVLGLVAQFYIGSDIPLYFMVGLIFIILFALLVNGIVVSHKKNIEEYKRKISDWEGYKESEKERIISEYKVYSENIIRYGNRDGKPEVESQQKEHIVKCPVCGSTEVKKISTAKKVVSTEFWGLASSDIGKQMVCEKCGYKF